MTLELVMIVKNSGEVLRNTLRSVKPFIDRWTILDTGSIDHTMDIIKEELSNIEGNLYQEEFIDFSTTRNRSLDLSSKQCKYTIILDDSYELKGGNKLIRFLKKNNNSSYSLKIGNLRNNIRSSYYYSLRIIKSSENLRYKSRVHEYIVDHKKTQFIKDKDIFINDLDDPEHAIRSRNRYERDIVFLLDELKENPKDPRILMYLALTYKSLKEFEKSMEYYEKMKTIKNIDKEYLFTAYYDSACLDHSEISQDDEKFRRELIVMQKLFPDRAESYYKLCVFLYEASNHLNQNYNSVANIANNMIKFTKPELYLTVLDTTIYDYYIPYLYIDVNLKVGNFDRAVPKLREMLDLYPNDQPLLNIKYAICDKSGLEIQDLSPGKTIVIHTGSIGWTWDPSTNTKISGSEYMAINMAREFSKLGYRSFIFGSFEDEEKKTDYQGIYDNVQYIDYKFFPEFSSKYTIDYLIVSRFVSNLVYYDNIKNVYLWVHDILPHMSKNAPVFQTHKTKFKGFIVLSEWHKNYVQTHLGVPDDMMILSRNAIYENRFSDYDLSKKIPYRFIYISDAYRGLNHLIDMIPIIKEKYPLTTLAIYTRIEHIEENTLKKIKELDYVSLNSRISQSEIKDELLKSDVWLYPTTFPETYCISALEAMAAGCLVAGVKYAGLTNTVENRGIMCEHPIKDKNNQDILLKKLFFVLDNQEIKQQYITKARDWALKQTYYNLAVEWIRMFKNV